MTPTRGDDSAATRDSSRVASRRAIAAASKTARTCIRVTSGRAMPRRHPRAPSMGFASRSDSACSTMAAGVAPNAFPCLAAKAPTSSPGAGRNSCNGGSSNRTVTGAPFAARKIFSKSSRWYASIASSASRRVTSSGARIMRRIARASLRRLEPHVFRARQTDPFGAVLHRRRGVLGGVGVGEHAEVLVLVRPSGDRRQVPRRAARGFSEPNRAADHLAGFAVDAQDVALAEGFRVAAVERHRFPGLVDAHRIASHHARFAPSSRDDRGASSSSSRREYASRGVHAADALRGGLRPHEKDVFFRARRASASAASNTMAPTAAPGLAGSPSRPHRSRTDPRGRRMGEEAGPRA